MDLTLISNQLLELEKTAAFHLHKTAEAAENLYISFWGLPDEQLQLLLQQWHDEGTLHQNFERYFKSTRAINRCAWELGIGRIVPEAAARLFWVDNGIVKLTPP